MYKLLKTLPAYFIVNDPIPRRGAEEQLKLGDGLHYRQTLIKIEFNYHNGEQC